MINANKNVLLEERVAAMLCFGNVSSDRCLKNNNNQEQSLLDILANVAQDEILHQTKKRKRVNNNITKSNHNSADNEKLYSIAALFPLGDSFIVHWFAYDRLRDLSAEPVSESICDRVCCQLMTDDVQQCYPWRTGSELLQLQRIFETKRNKFGKIYTWIDLWTLPYEKLWLQTDCCTTHHKAAFQERQRFFFSSCVKAMWRLDDKKNYLLHVSLPNETLYDKIYFGFYIFPVEAAPAFLNEEIRITLMTVDLSSRYPWRTGQQGCLMIRQLLARRDINTTVQDLVK